MQAGLCSIWRGNYNEIEIARLIPQHFGGVNDPGLGMCAPSLVLPLGITRYNCREREPRRGFDQGAVKDCARESIPNQSNANGAGRICDH